MAIFSSHIYSSSFSFQFRKSGTVRSITSSLADHLLIQFSVNLFRTDNISVFTLLACSCWKKWCPSMMGNLKVWNIGLQTPALDVALGSKGLEAGVLLARDELRRHRDLRAMPWRSEPPVPVFHMD
jgi:hypothetical protein